MTFFAFYGAVIKILGKWCNKHQSLWRQFKTCGSWKHLCHSCFSPASTKQLLPGTKTYHEAKPEASPDHLQWILLAPRTLPLRQGLWQQVAVCIAQKTDLLLFLGAAGSQNTVLKPETKWQECPVTICTAECLETDRKNDTIIQFVIQFSVTSHSLILKGSRLVSSQPYFSAVFSDLHNSADDVTCTLLTESFAKQPSHTSKPNSNSLKSCL